MVEPITEGLVVFAELLKLHPTIYDYNRNTHRLLSLEMEVLSVNMRQYLPNFTLEDCARYLTQCRGILLMWRNEVPLHNFCNFD